MPTYTPPLRDMQFVMHELFKVADEFRGMPRHADIDRATIDAVLEEAGKFATEVTLPLNATGDAEGCHLDPATHIVTTPKGFKEAYAKYVEGGWPALSGDPEFGGQGLADLRRTPTFHFGNRAVRHVHVQDDRRHRRRGGERPNDLCGNLGG